MECLGENKEKYNAFSVPTDSNETFVTMSYKINFIDSAKLWQFNYQFSLKISQKEFSKPSSKIAIVFE